MPRRNYNRDRRRPPHDETFIKFISRTIKESKTWNRTTSGPAASSRRN